MTNINEDLILEALKEIEDPSQSKDIVSLGLINNITIKDSNVAVTLEVPVHRGASMEPIRKLAQERVLNIKDVTSATVVVTAHENKEKPSTFETDKEDKVEKVLESNVKRFVAIGSGKGGVGKSTTSANIAIALKLEGYKVGLLDADVYGPSQPRMLGVSGRPASVGGDMVAPLQNYGISLMSMGLLVPDDTAMIWRGPMVQSALTQMLNSVAWGDLDVIVIDLPPGTGDIQISLAQQVNLAGAIIVSTPQDIALLDVVKALTMFQKANVPVLGMIENMSYWSCPDCGRVDHIFGEGGVKAEAKKRNIDLLGEIPISVDVRKSSDAGIPIIISEPESIQSQNYRLIAKSIIKSIKLDEEELS
ncbi:MAG: Mrp/NBP35 family ATP-binding protein [Alphaproteobacteria bacterium]|nr:Mrp/NBP35 family ATP-binding protein [Alphaproteobacteria bacterium]MDG1981913.1 Mrp/NBP35 family ATP-binding protein [Alphaproteobacteria bacterium]MDG2458146.1 Mrp/NBP35 family ATP-binding protein [Alphaproteobacteria bacterium]